MTKPLRTLAIAAIAGQLLFIASWMLAATLEPGYSPLDHVISELAARDAENPGIVTIGFVMLGGSFVCLAAALWIALRPGPWRVVVAALFVVAGVLAAAHAALPLDCRPNMDRQCAVRENLDLLSWRHYAHAQLLIPFGAALVASVAAVGLALRPSRWSRWLALGALAMAGLFLLYLRGFPGPTPEGFDQRLVIAPVHAWALIVAGGCLVADARHRAPARR